MAGDSLLFCCLRLNLKSCLQYLFGTSFHDIVLSSHQVHLQYFEKGKLCFTLPGMDKEKPRLPLEWPVALNWLSIRREVVQVERKWSKNGLKLTHKYGGKFVFQHTCLTKKDQTFLPKWMVRRLPGVAGGQGCLSANPALLHSRRNHNLFTSILHQHCLIQISHFEKTHTSKVFSFLIEWIFHWIEYSQFQYFE